MTDGRVCCLLPSPLLFWRLLSFVLPHPVLSPAVVNYLLMSFTRLLLTLPWINTCSPTILSSFFNPGVSVPPHPWPLPREKYPVVPPSVRAKAFQQRSLKFPRQFDPVYRSPASSEPIRRRQLIKCRREQKENVHAITAAAVRGSEVLLAFCLHSISDIFGYGATERTMKSMKSIYSTGDDWKKLFVFFLIFLFILFFFFIFTLGLLAVSGLPISERIKLNCCNFLFLTIYFLFSLRYVS